jgi:cytidine deaminase
MPPLDQKLVDAAIGLLVDRFPQGHFQGAAAMYTADGDILLSTAPGFENSAVDLCHETGAICEAFTKNKPITASVCVSREEPGRYVILAACGVCQERLWFWGGDVEIAVPEDDDNTKWRAVKLRDMAPYYWRKPYMK